MSQQNFGGPQRTIHTTTVEKARGLVADVVDIQIRKSGIYNQGWGSSDYWSGEYDYEPPYLSDQKTHRILVLDKWFWKDDNPKLIRCKSSWYEIWKDEDISFQMIEDCNVIRVTEKGENIISTIEKVLDK